MLALPTFNQFYQAGQNEIQARKPTLSDFNAGSTLDAITGGGAVMADEVMRVVLALFAAQFVDMAAGADLDALAADRFGLTRKAAVAAIGTATFSQSSGALVVVPVGTHLKAAVNGRSVTFTTDADIDVPDGDFGSITATCTETGSAGNVDVETVTTVVDALPGVVLAVTNLERFVGGQGAETDAAFRDRIRRFYTTQRKATLAALEEGALSVAGVAYVTVAEKLIAPEIGGYSYVAIYVGDPDGRGNAALADAVTAEIVNWRAAGVQVLVFASEREEISLEMVATVKTGSDQDTLKTMIRTAILAYTDNIAPGKPLYISQVVAAAVDVSDLVLGVTMADPMADLEPSAAYRALRVVATDIAITFVEA